MKLAAAALAALLASVAASAATARRSRSRRTRRAERAEAVHRPQGQAAPRSTPRGCRAIRSWRPTGATPCTTTPTRPTPTATRGRSARDLRIFSQSSTASAGSAPAASRSPSTSSGRLITTCISATTVELRLMDPRTLNTVASHLLPPRVIPPGVTRSRRPGGAYFYVDNKDRAVVSIGPPDLRGRDPGQQRSSASAPTTCTLGDPGRRPAQLGAARLERPALVRHPPARHRRRARPGAPAGVLGTPPHGRGDRQLVRDGRDRRRVHRHRQGAVPLRRRPRAASPSVTWRVRYDNIGMQKPGQFDAGSGTTPTLMGKRLPVDRRQRRPA